MVPLPTTNRSAEPLTFLRPKGNLSRTELVILGIVALVPLVTMAIRILSLPGFVGPNLGGLQSIGSALRETMSLTAVPLDQRAHVLYLLLLPTCALLVALARLTFGIRVLGFRSILIAVAFHASGIVPSLLLIGVAVATVVLVRPWLRKIKLPYYARVSIVLCMVTTAMVAALVAGPWVRADFLWGAAYFPVIVLGMLAEGIAHTLERDNIVTAIWRATTTILLAFLIALICWIPLLRTTFLQYPELVLTQIVAIVMISEYLDLRLLEDWDKKVAGVVLPKLFSSGRARPRVAVVRNRIEAGDENRSAPRRPALRSVQKIVDALRRGGHKVKVLEGDASLLKELHRFFPLDPRDGKPDGIVLNLAHGIQGDARTTHVPAILEMSGVAYIGPSPIGHATAFDRVVTKALMQQAGVPTPRFWVVADPRDKATQVRYPAIVRPRRDPSVRPRVVEDRRQLRAAVKTIARRYRQEAFIEEDVAGRRISVAVLGNAPIELLPLVELDSASGEKLCPAPLDEVLAERIRECAREAFRVCGCRDYARIDTRIDAGGEPWVVEVNTLGVLAGGGSFARAGLEAGLSFDQLVCKIVEVGQARYRSGTSGARVSPRSSVDRNRKDRGRVPDRLQSKGSDPSPTITPIS